uniref:Uncharacterized protein n=1 Tax=Panagrolaimus sp. PS1159 TaxID=55785 RepID=A0AC35FMX2_9BILA
GGGEIYKSTVDFVNGKICQKVVKYERAVRHQPLVRREKNNTALKVIGVVVVGVAFVCYCPLLTVLAPSSCQLLGPALPLTACRLLGPALLRTAVRALPRMNMQ